MYTLSVYVHSPVYTVHVWKVTKSVHFRTHHGCDITTMTTFVLDHRWPWNFALFTSFDMNLTVCFMFQPGLFSEQGSQSEHCSFTYIINCMGDKERLENGHVKMNHGWFWYVNLKQSLWKDFMWRKYQKNVDMGSLKP